MFFLYSDLQMNNIKLAHWFSSCDSNCRHKWFCDLNYAVGEQTLFCKGYNLSFEEGFWYIFSAFINPWYIRHGP